MNKSTLRTLAIIALILNGIAIILQLGVGAIPVATTHFVLLGVILYLCNRLNVWGP